MSAQLGLSLPIGTKVRRKIDSKIVAKLENSDENGGLVAFIDGDLLCFLSDDEWELIEEEPKQGDEIKFGDMVYVRDEEDNDWDENPTVYLGKKGNKHYTLGFGDTLDESGDGEQWYVFAWDEVKKVPNKIELTIEEIEEKLGYEKGSLIVK